MPRENLKRPLYNPERETRNPKPITRKENRMSTFKQSPANGHTIIAKVLPGCADKLRQAYKDQMTDPRAAPAMAKIGTIHYARWVLINNDTQFLYTTIFDGEHDKYWEDFCQVFVDYGREINFKYCEGWPKDAMTNVPAQVKFFNERSVPHLAEYGAYPDLTVREILKMRKVYEAFQKVLDNPAAHKALQDPALKSLLEVASD